MRRFVAPLTARRRFAARCKLSTRVPAANSFPDDFYFRQFSPGVDIANDPDNPLHQVAAKMGNYFYALGDRNTMQTVIIDPCYTHHSIIDVTWDDEMSVNCIIATHSHFDSIGAASKDLGFGPVRVPGIYDMSREARCPDVLYPYPKGLPIYIHHSELEAAREQTGLEVQVGKGKKNKIKPLIMMTMMMMVRNYKRDDNHDMCRFRFSYSLSALHLYHR